MREQVIEDVNDAGGKLSRVYKGTRVLCDNCMKVLSNTDGKILVPYFNVSTHYRSDGMEVLNSYRRADYCSETCLMNEISNYFKEVREYTNEREIHIHFTGDREK